MKIILFVENDPVVLTMYRNRLQAAGFTVETAEDGLEALKILSRSTPDLAVLDLMLPKLSGAEVLKFIRTESRLKQTPVILFSNAYMTELGDDSILAGANKRLLKAYSTPASLLEAINELLSAPPVEIPLAPAQPTALLPDEPSNSTPASSASIEVVGIVPAPAEPAAGTPVHNAEILEPKDRNEFFQKASTEIAGLREHCRAYVKAPAAKDAQEHLAKLHTLVQELSAESNQTDCTRASMLLKAFSALLSEVITKPAWTSPSILQTIAQAADSVDLLLKNTDVCSSAVTKGKVLVVDDDLVCNHVMVTSLKRANLEPVSVQNPKEGLRRLQTDSYDAVLLDVNMPDMTGFEVCEQLRRLPHCKTTPVIFVTAYSNFQNRTQGVLSGGDDFITKPVSPLELALKVTIHMLKSHVERGGAPLPPAEPATADVSDQALQIIAAAQIDQLQQIDSASAELPDGLVLASTETATSPDPGAIAPQSISPAASEPPPVPAAPPVPDFVPATETSPELVAPTTDTGTSPPAIELVPTIGDLPEEVLQLVAAIEKAEVEANDDAAVNAAWPSLESKPVEAPIEAVRLAGPQASTLAEFVQADLISGESTAAIRPAAPDPAHDVFAVAGPVASEPTSSTPFQASAPTDLFQVAKEPSDAPAVFNGPSTEPPAPTGISLAAAAAIEELLQPAPAESNSGTVVEPVTAPPVVSSTTESHNSIVVPDVPTSEPTAIEPVSAPEVPISFVPSSTDSCPEVPETAPSAALSSSEPVAPAASTPSEPGVLENESQNEFLAAALPSGPPLSELMAPIPSDPPPAVEPPANIVSVEPPAEPVPAEPAKIELVAEIIPAPPSTEVPQPPVIESTLPSATDSSAAESIAPASPEVIPAAPVAPEPVAEVHSDEPARESDAAPAASAPETSFRSPALAWPHAKKKSAPNPNFDKVVYQVTRMVYGDDNVNPMNLRMVRVALEHYGIHELIIKP